MCHIVCKTLTNAQRSSRYLSRNGIAARVKRLPSELREENGCGYAVSVDDDHLHKALDMLRDIDIQPKMIYKTDRSGEYREMTRYERTGRNDIFG